MTTKNNFDNNIAVLKDHIVAGKKIDGVNEITLDEFIHLYHLLNSHQPNPRIDIVLLGNRAIAQFTGFKPRINKVYIRSDTKLFPENFEKVIANAVFHGDILASNFPTRLREEKKGILLSTAFGMVVLILLVIAGWYSADDYGKYILEPQSYQNVAQFISLITKLNEMILTSATLFLSVFLIFTVSQSIQLQKDIKLFSSGLLHKFERDDRLIAGVAIGCLLLSIVNVVILWIPASMEITSIVIIKQEIVLNKISFISPLLTSLAITLLMYSFISLFYYLKRTILITSRNMTIQVLDIAKNQYDRNKG